MRDQHYFTGNEQTLGLFHATVHDRGGGYLGVGSDQNYLLAAWQRASFIFIVDFDQDVVDLHLAYVAFLEAAATPAAFLAHWRRANRAASRALLERRWAGTPRAAGALRAFERAGGAVERRLDRVRRTVGAEHPTFLEDAAQYAHLRGLAQAGRIVAVRGDYTADLTLLGLAAALRRTGQGLEVIYLSNIEQYFDYGPGFRRNMAALPTSADATVIRTLGWRMHAVSDVDRYHYSAQAMANFRTWLTTTRVRGLPGMLAKRTRGEPHYFSVIEATPEPSKLPPEIAPAPATP